jgi:D-serine deaminase-like pyridoxal phosphate-dependent protein
MIDDSDMAVHLAAALLSMPEDLRAAVDGTVRAMARDRIWDCDQQSVPLEMALAVYGGVAAEIWVEIKRREMGRKS